MKTAIYARYSTDMQKDTSIEDQIRVCKMHYERENWQFTRAYSDSAKSGGSLMRTGIQELMQDAMTGLFDVIIVEDLDRISRDQEDIAAFYKRMEFADVKIYSLADGWITDIHVGLKGTMSARFLKDVASKTHRGLRGRVEAGKSGGGKAYGYDVKRTIKENGEIELGDREINPEQAQVINRIFKEYVAGKSPKKIALGLNEDGILGPSGKGWGASTLHGNRKRGTGILNNELYVGRLIWNRVKYLRDPDTRKRVTRHNPEEEWVIADVPHLRILDQELWENAKKRQGEYIRRDRPLWKMNRPKKLLSYLVKCGVCGGGCSMVSQTHYGCSTARNKGTCDNRRMIKREKLEEIVIEALQVNLMDKDLCAKFCREYTEHVNNLRKQHNIARAGYEKELAKIKREKEKLVEAVLNGVPGNVLKEKGEYILKRTQELEDIINSVEEAPVLLHPNMAERYHQEINQLIDALNNEEHREEAADLIRSLVDKIVLTPKEGAETGLSVDLIGDLAGILSIATNGDKSLIEGGVSFMNQSQQEIEPTTQEALVAGVGFEL